jgi:CRISPR system Cascade subunit CasD
MQTTTIQIKGSLGTFHQNPKSQYRLTKPAAQMSRSAIIGLLACCMGIERDGDMSELQELTFQITDRQANASILSDYHAVKGAVTNGGSGDRASVTHREYIEGVDLLIAIVGAASTIAKVDAAVRHPVWAPYIGSRACPLSAPLVPAQITSQAFS